MTFERCVKLLASGDQPYGAGCGDCHRSLDAPFRQAPRDHRCHLHGLPGGGLRIPRPQRCREIDDDSSASRPVPTQFWARHGVRARPAPGWCRGAPAAGLPTWRAGLVSAVDRPGDSRPRGTHPRPQRPSLPRRARGSVRSRTRPPGAHSVQGQRAEDRAHSGIRAPTRAAGPRRTHLGAGPAAAGRVHPPGPRNRQRRAHGLPLVT